MRCAAALTSARWPRRRFARLALRWVNRARAYAGFREDSHFYLITGLGVIRLLLLERGRRLAERGALDRPDDIFYLEMSEIENAPERIRETADGRRARRTALLRDYSAIPAELLDEPADADHRLDGVPASRGEAVGPVRVIRDPSEFPRMAEGDVLVCPYTNSGWTLWVPDTVSPHATWAYSRSRLRACWATQAAVGFAVTPSTWTRRRGTSCGSSARSAIPQLTPQIRGHV